MMRSAYSKTIASGGGGWVRQVFGLSAEVLVFWSFKIGTFHVGE